MVELSACKSQTRLESEVDSRQRKVHQLLGFHLLDPLSHNSYVVDVPVVALLYPMGLEDMRELCLVTTPICIQLPYDICF